MAEDFRLTGKLVINGIQGLDAEIPKLRRQLESLKITPQNVGFDKSIAGVEKLSQSTKQANREISATVTSLQDFSDKAALALRRFTAFSLAAGATFGSLRLIFGGLKNAATFERELIKVRQVSGATANSIASLRDEITRLGNSLAAPASELADVSKTLSQAGFRIGEVKTLLENLAQTRLAATFGSIQDTTEGIIAIAGQFKIQVGEMGDALGITNAVAAKYAVESEGLISAVRRTGGVFAAASSGISEGTQALSEFYALFTSVQQTTRQANETIATGLRTVFARLERPKTISYFKDLGVDLTDASGKFIGVFNAIQKISQAIDGLDTRSLKFAEIVEAIGGARQLGVVVPLLKEWRLQQEVLNTALGGTKSLLNDAALPLQTLSAQVEILANNFSAFSRDVFNSNSFQFLAKEAINFANAIVRVADSISGLLPLFAALGVAKFGAAVASEGAVGYLTTRLKTGAGGPGIHKATGGYIPGTGSGDKIPIMAEPGEFVIRKGAAQRIGTPTLQKLNNIDKFNMGGMVGRRLPGYAEGGKVGIDFGSDKEFNDIRKEFRNLAKSIGISNDEFNRLANEVRILAKDVPEARKLFQGGVKSKTYTPPLASFSNAPELPNYEQLETKIRIQDAKRQKILNQKPFTVYNQSRKYISEDERNRNIFANLPTTDSLDSIVSNYRTPFPLSMEQRKLRGLDISRQARFLDSATNRSKADAVAFGAVTNEISGPGQRTLFNRGRASIPQLPDLEANDPSIANVTYSQADLYAAGINKIPTRQGSIFAKPINRLRSRARLAGQFVRNAPGAIGRGARGIGSRVLNGDPATLGLLAAGVQYGGDKLGLDPTLTGGLSGALGGAALGGAFGGPVGSALGGIAGGITGLASASQRKELDKIDKELTKSAKELTKAFSDLSVGGVAKLDQALKTQLNLTSQRADISNRGIAQNIGAAFGNSTNFVSGTYSGLNAAGRSIGIGLVGFDDEKAKARASELASSNAEVAQQSRDRIKFLVSRGRQKDISDTLVQGAISDDESKLAGLSAARSNRNDNGATLRNLIAEARGNLIKNEDSNKGTGLDIALRNIDTFASRLEKSSNLLGLFNSNLENSQSAIQSAFDVASGNFTINRSLQNPFENIEALNKGQVRGAVGNLESFLGTSIDAQSRGVLEAAPVLKDLPNIINAERVKAEKAGFNVTDSGKFIEGLLNQRGGPLGNLPGRVKQDLGDVFGNLSTEDTQAYLSGNVDNRNAQEIQNKIGQITDKTVATFKKLQDSSNELAKTFLVNAANQRSVLVASQVRLGANRQDAITNSILTKDNLRGVQTNPLTAIGLQQNSLKELTGLQDVFPTNITQNINDLLKERAALESSVNIGELEKSRRLSDVNAKLTTNKEALDKLASSAIGLAEIQTKLSEVQGRQLGLADSVINDALGGNQEGKIRGKVALQAFQQGGLGRVQGLGLNPDDLKTGISQEEQRKALIEGEQAAKDFKLKIAQQLNTQSSGILIPAGEARQNAAAFKDLDTQKQSLLQAADTALATQVIAIEQQRKLLSANLEDFDKVITNKFVAGITQLAAVVQQLNVPETISIQATHIHQFQFTGLNIANLDPAMRKIAEEAVNGALSKLTDGNVKNGQRIPGAAIKAAVEEGFGG